MKSLYTCILYLFKGRIMHFNVCVCVCTWTVSHTCMPYLFITITWVLVLVSSKWQWIGFGSTVSNCWYYWVYIFTAHEKPIWIVSDTRRRSDMKWFKENYGTAVKTVRVLADDDVRRQRGWVFTAGNMWWTWKFSGLNSYIVLIFNWLVIIFTNLPYYTIAIIIIITPWSWNLLEKLPVAQLLKNFPTFYGTQRFITDFTSALQWSLS
jgi:hypothetical protein